MSISSFEIDIFLEVTNYVFALLLENFYFGIYTEVLWLDILVGIKLLPHCRIGFIGLSLHTLAMSLMSAREGTT